MKFVIQNHEDLMKLVHWYAGEAISADEYFAAVEAWASVLVDREIKYNKLRKEFGM